MTCRMNTKSETSLDKYFFHHLTQKNPLRSQVIQQASQIINAVRHYRKSDGLVEFFARALKH